MYDLCTVRTIILTRHRKNLLSDRLSGDGEINLKCEQFKTVKLVLWDFSVLTARLRLSENNNQHKY
jgi:hypothetical protein